MWDANPDRREASGKKLSLARNRVVEMAGCARTSPRLKLRFFLTVALVNHRRLHQLHDQLPHPQIDLLTRVSPKLFLLLNNIQALLIMY